MKKASVFLALLLFARQRHDARGRDAAPGDGSPAPVPAGGE